MATSGSYNFAVTRDDLIKDAMLEIGQLEPGEAPDAEETTDCARRLNMMVKSWVVKGYHLWAIENAVLFQTLGALKYRIGDQSTDAEWCLEDDYNQVTTTVAAALGAGTITVSSAASIASADRIGIVLDTGAIQWTTVNGAPAGAVVTLTAVLTGAVAAGNVVFTYTARPVRPLRMVPNTTYRRDINGNDTPIELIGLPEYELLTSKPQRGKTIQMTYMPTLIYGTLWTWPTADLSTDTIRFSYERPIQDFDLTTDNPDFPIEAAKALYLNLAADICGIFGAADELDRLRSPDGESGLADQALLEWLSWDREQAPVKFQPDIRSSRGSSASRRW